jgi:hypothetical protein
LQNFLQRLSIGAIAKESAFAADDDQAFVLQFIEVMRERGARNIELGLDFTDNHAFGVRREKQLHDAEARFCAIAENKSANLATCAAFFFDDRVSIFR